MESKVEPKVYQLVEVILDVHVRGVKIKYFLIQILLWCILYKKGS
jgi:hypothetical protein